MSSTNGQSNKDGNASAAEQSPRQKSADAKAQETVSEDAGETIDYGRKRSILEPKALTSAEASEAREPARTPNFQATNS